MHRFATEPSISSNYFTSSNSQADFMRYDSIVILTQLDFDESTAKPTIESYNTFRYSPYSWDTAP